MPAGAGGRIKRLGRVWAHSSALRPHSQQERAVEWACRIPFGSYPVADCRAGGGLSLNSGDIIASRYVLERPLAKGGMGAVWVARHLELDALVALKVMAPEHADTFFARDRFQREARACAQIQHPNVVAVHDYGVADDVPFLVMELL